MPKFNLNNKTCYNFRLAEYTRKLILWGKLREYKLYLGISTGRHYSTIAKSFRLWLFCLLAL